MNLDLLIVVAGTLGALANRWAGPGPTMTRATAIESLVAGLIMVVVNALGLVPKDLQDAMTQNPIRTGAFVFVAAFLAGPGIISVGKGLLFKAAPKLVNGPPGNAQGGSGSSGGDPAAGPKGTAHLGLLVALAALAGLLVGCAGWQRSTIALPRDPTLVAYGEARATYQFAAYLLAQGCATKRIEEAVCRVAADVGQRARTLDAILQAALAKADTLRPQDLQAFLGLASQVAAIAGYPVIGAALGGLRP